MGKLTEFDPCIHYPVTDHDRRSIENALWEGWELWVNEDSGEVWIGHGEEKIAEITVR